jgi:hypothetical protein
LVHKHNEVFLHDTCARTRTHTCTHNTTHTYAHTHVHIYIHTHSLTHSLTHAHTPSVTHTRTHTHTYAHTLVHTCTHAHAHPHAHTHSCTLALSTFHLSSCFIFLRYKYTKLRVLHTGRKSWATASRLLLSYERRAPCCTHHIRRQPCWGRHCRRMAQSAAWRFCEHSRFLLNQHAA